MADISLKRIDPEDYKTLVVADTGRPLTDLYPNGIYVTLRGDEIVGISPEPVEESE